MLKRGVMEQVFSVEEKVTRVSERQSAADFPVVARDRFLTLVEDPSFPCLGAKGAINNNSYCFSTYDSLASDSTSKKLACALGQFAKSEMARTNDYATFIAVFQAPLSVDEIEFERLLWLQLQKLHDFDTQGNGWDPSVSPDPGDARFSFSFAGQAFYVIGMHADSSRIARQSPWPALIFNPHAQFEKLRTKGHWRRMQEKIRERDIALQGTINPMLSDFGEASEARQYSGRTVEENWRPDFRVVQPKSKNGGCPFHH